MGLPAKKDSADPSDGLLFPVLTFGATTPNNRPYNAADKLNDYAHRGTKNALGTQKNKNERQKDQMEYERQQSIQPCTQRKLFS